MPGTFALTIVPPAQLAECRPQPRDVVFAIDRSGSMAGWKMVAARRAVGRLLDTLLEHDRFSVLAFDNTVEFSPETPRQLAPAVNRARWRTIEWLAKVDSRGGTEMAAALRAAVELLSATSAERQPMIVLITDGQVAGEDMLLKTLADAAHGRPPRIYAIGIDQAVNAGFLRRLADLGRGACELVESEDRLDFRTVGETSRVRARGTGFRPLVLHQAETTDRFARQFASVDRSDAVGSARTCRRSRSAVGTLPRVDG